MACIVAIVPVSVPLSNLIMDGITLVSYKYSKYLRVAVGDPDHRRPKLTPREKANDQFMNALYVV